jgi:ADP-heptose:LPS heptosyltransferase
MHRLVAGPWTGEFGWELFSWQGLIRKAARDYDETIVCGPPNSEALYSDFTSKYLVVSIPGVRDCWRVETKEREALAAAKDQLRKFGGDWLQPFGPIPVDKQRFIKFGKKGNAPGADVIVHARKAVGKRPEHAWDPKHCDEVVRRLIERGRTVFAVGLSAEAYCPPEAKDCRDVPLYFLMDTLASSRLALGPSSGPMHLASLCGTPHLVWTDTSVYSAIGATNRARYESLWNPLKTRAIVLDSEGWRPSVESVLAAVEGFLSETP